MNRIRLRNAFITIFVILWTALFHYESLRYFYLNPWFQRELPKMKLLFPPAGWIMFFNVPDQFGYVEVYGMKDGKGVLIDPHDIFRTRTIGFDNIHRNILSSVARRQLGPSFCRYMRERFSYFDEFYITNISYPNLTKEPMHRVQQVNYRCVE